MILKLLPEYRDYVWGGTQRLRPGQLTAEAWVVYEGNKIAEGPQAGRTLGELAAELGQKLVGPAAFARTGGRFPVLIKLLDCERWLSVQVHPNDSQAVELEGAGQWGKTEAWHILEAAPGAGLIAGVNPGTSREALAEAIRNGGIMNFVQEQSIRQGDTIFMPAGTIHALGPGLLVYEVQQTSDLTYRVFDWNRPASPARPLHIEQSVRVSDPSISGQISHLPALAAQDIRELAACQYFHLELIALDGMDRHCNTGGASFHALTVIAGQVDVLHGAEQAQLGLHDTVLIPADGGEYVLRPRGAARLLRASAPGA